MNPPKTVHVTIIVIAIIAVVGIDRFTHPETGVITDNFILLLQVVHVISPSNEHLENVWL